MEQQKQEQKKNKIATGTVKSNEKSGLSKAMGNFFVRDIHEAGEYICRNLIVPKLRSFVDEVITGAVHAVLGGGSGKSQGGGKTNYDYNARYVPSKSREDYSRYEYDRVDYDFRDITFESRADAENVLDTLHKDLNKYKYVSVADLYDYAGLNYNNRQGRKYGWSDLRSADIVSVRDGWAIRMPPVMPLD